MADVLAINGALQTPISMLSLAGLLDNISWFTLLPHEEENDFQLK